MKQYTLVKCGKLFDGIDSCFKENMQILVEDDLIKEVGENLVYPESASIVDLSDKQVTPGLIDAHIHPMFMDWRRLSEDFGMVSDTWDSLSVLYCAQRSLERGFTTIRIMTSSPAGYGALDVKRAIENNIFKGSRLVVSANWMGATAGHGDWSIWKNTNYRIAETMKCQGIGTGKDFFIEAIRNEVKYGSDFIKIMFTGGFCTPQDTPVDQQMTDEETRTCIEMAKSLNRSISAHVYEPKSIQKLVNFGITGIEHASLIDEETARLLEEKDVYCVPTFCPNDEIIDLDEEKMALKPHMMQVKLRQYQQQLIDGRKTLINSNIRLGYGTDHVAVYDPYDSWTEFRSWMKSGMDPFRILKAATSVNAGILERKDIGVIAPGYKADIAAWHRDLLKDPDALKECDFVMKNGSIEPTVYVK